MPRGDHTGPLGQGPMTGRGMGACKGAGGPGFMNRGLGAGAGRGSGRGRRWRNVFRATGLTGWQRAVGAETAESATNPDPAAPPGPVAPMMAPDSRQDLAMLKQQADGLAATLDEIRKRIAEIQAAQPGPEQEGD